tara:strand:- start:58 stop:273 length:216 start_codon:yes stop_codon:yes gene_type:complete
MRNTMNLIGWFSAYYLAVNFIQLLKYIEVKKTVLIFLKINRFKVVGKQKGFYICTRSMFLYSCYLMKFSLK